jgi:hypothetical protein
VSPTERDGAFPNRLGACAGPVTRDSAHHTLATPARLTVQAITLALLALLLTGILAVAIVLATSDGGDQAGGANSAKPTEAINYGGFNPSTGRPESAPLPPSAISRPGSTASARTPNHHTAVSQSRGPPPVGPTSCLGACAFA